MTLSTDAVKRIALWSLSGSTGVSAKTIACVALGIKENARVDFDMPYDAGDFGRCLRLLEMVPELHEYLPAVAQACPQWGPLLPIWSELTLLYSESPEDCHNRFREIRDSCREAGGWKRLSESQWVRTRPLPEGAE